MEKIPTVKLLTKSRARYTWIGRRAASDNSPLPVRIKVLSVQVPIGNPYDIGIQETLLALRRSGVLTKTGKLGKPFR